MALEKFYWNASGGEAGVQYKVIKPVGWEIPDADFEGTDYTIFAAEEGAKVGALDGVTTNYTNWRIVCGGECGASIVAHFARKVRATNM